MRKVCKITKEAAIEIYESKAWEKMTPAARGEFQLYTDKLCMPFEKFHEGLEALLGRPVWTHEFALADELREEFEIGKGTSPMDKANRLF